MRVLRFATAPMFIAASFLMGPAIPAVASPFIPLPTAPGSAQVGAPIPAPMPVIPQHARTSGPAVTIRVNHGREKTSHVSVMLNFPDFAGFVTSGQEGTWPDGSFTWLQGTGARSVETTGCEPNTTANVQVCNVMQSDG